MVGLLWRDEEQEAKTIAEGVCWWLGGGSMVATRTFSLVCFHVVPANKNEDYVNKVNRQLLEAVNSSGKIFISHTVLSGKYVLRFVVGAPLTEERHVIEAWKLFQETASTLLTN
ncbi:unnamed protein product [Lactuca virosa]|uniref:Tyrosine decarboxylase n=1 Tax=Lactuca virosa TaxID=75947 RepID=A0AAU9NKK5_9ASTR|nr:unnamed protein product [Lactuca virosa]